MKTSERHHLKENEVAIALRHANEFVRTNQRTLGFVVIAIVVAAAAAGGFFAWRSNVNSKARGLLAEAMVIQEARVMAPMPAAEGTAPPTQQPGTYPTEKAKLEAALPKFIAAADAYPRTDAGQMARYHAAAALVALGRNDEAIRQYEDVIDDGSGLVSQMARLGKAEAQLRAAQYDAAIASLKELSDRTDLDVPKEALLLELARAYRLAGKQDDATKTLTQIVEQHGDSPFATEARQELDKLKG
jgi:tetratricopeptide (TPR) repeat protein